MAARVSLMFGIGVLLWLLSADLQRWRSSFSAETLRWNSCAEVSNRALLSCQKLEKLERD